MAATLQMAVFPVRSATLSTNQANVKHTVYVHTAEVGRITSDSTWHVGRESHDGGRKEEE